MDFFGHIEDWEKSYNIRFASYPGLKIIENFFKYFYYLEMQNF